MEPPVRHRVSITSNTGSRGVALASGPTLISASTWGAITAIRSAFKWNDTPPEHEFRNGVVTPSLEDLPEGPEQPSLSLHTDSLEADRC
jgi:hypothetical protein